MNEQMWIVEDGKARQAKLSDWELIRLFQDEGHQNPMVGEDDNLEIIEGCPNCKAGLYHDNTWILCDDCYKGAIKIQKFRAVLLGLVAFFVSWAAFFAFVELNAEWIAKMFICTCT